LDEYEGLDADMVKLFSKAAASANVKVCVSSRPHLVFQDAFATGPGLRLQDLTASDIREYVTDRLTEDRQMQELIVREPIESPKLLYEIVTRSSGVFLWVELVVTSLLMGLGNHDSISDLQRRLRLLPRDLEQLYHRIVLKVDEIYREDTAQLFQLVDAASIGSNEWASIPANDFDGSEQLTIFTLALTQLEKYNVTNTNLNVPWDSAQIMKCCEDMDDRLKSRCGGLLETRFHKKTGLLPSTKVVYHHRTVRDFLVRPESRELLAGQTADTGFNANFMLHRAFTHQLSITPAELIREEDITICINASLTFAQRANTDGGIELPSSFEELITGAKKYWPKIKGGTFFLEEDPLKLAVCCGLDNYVKKVLSANPGLANQKNLLPLALVPKIKPPHLYINLFVRAMISLESKGQISMFDETLLQSNKNHFPSISMVKLLLEFGANPNQPFQGSTPWKHLLQYLYSVDDSYDSSSTSHWALAILVLLKYGAESSAVFEYQFENDMRKSKISKTFVTFPEVLNHMNLGDHKTEVFAELQRRTR
jgi:hypothetical protein